MSNNAEASSSTGVNRMPFRLELSNTEETVPDGRVWINVEKRITVPARIGKNLTIVDLTDDIYKQIRTVRNNIREIEIERDYVISDLTAGMAEDALSHDQFISSVMGSQDQFINSVREPYNKKIEKLNTKIQNLRPPLKMVNPDGSVKLLKKLFYDFDDEYTA